MIRLLLSKQNYGPKILEFELKESLLHVRLKRNVSFSKINRHCKDTGSMHVGAFRAQSNTFFEFLSPQKLLFLILTEFILK